MTFARRFVLIQLAPPLLIALPAALLLLRHVMSLSGQTWLRLAQFGTSLRELLRQGKEFSTAVARFQES